MAILKTSPSELAIHGGGPPAFASKLPAFTANVGDGHRFGELAERMFLSNEAPGRMAQEFEAALAGWLGVGNVVGFSSLSAAVRGIARCFRMTGRVFVPAFGAPAFALEENLYYLDCESGTFGMSPTALAQELRQDASAVFAVNALGRPCMIQELEDVCDEWSVPLLLLGHQALGCVHKGERLGSLGHAEIFELGRDQLVHAMDAAVVTTNDDLLAHRLRNARSLRTEGVDQNMGDAAAAMGIANLESADSFIEQNKARYDMYREHMLNVPGMKLVRHDHGSNYQSIAIEVDPGLSGITRDALCDVLSAENIGTAKPFDGNALMSTPAAARIACSLVQLPSGPAATEEAIQAVCKLIELAVIRSLESPDPIRLAA